MGTIQDHHRIKEACDYYESTLGILFKMAGVGSIVAGEALNKHNPGYLSQLMKEQSDGKIRSSDREQGLEARGLHSEVRPYGRQSE